MNEQTIGAGAIPLLPILMGRPPPPVEGVGGTVGIDRAVALGPVLLQLIESEGNFGLDRAVARAYLEPVAARELSEALGFDAVLISPDLARQAGAVPMRLCAAVETAQRALKAAVFSKMAAAAARLLGPDFFALAARWAAGHFEADRALAAQDEAVRQYLDQLLGLGPIPIHDRPPTDVYLAKNAASMSPRSRLLRAQREQALRMLSDGTAVAMGDREFDMEPVRINAGLWRGHNFRPALREGAIIFGDRVASTKLFNVRFSRAADLPAADPKFGVAAVPSPIVVERAQLKRLVWQFLVGNREKCLRIGKQRTAELFSRQAVRAEGIPWKLNTIQKRVTAAWEDLMDGRKL